MEWKIYKHNLKKGLDSDLDSSLDSPNTAVFVFGAAKYRNQKKVFKQIQQKFAQSIIVGCSGAGEIYGSHVYDDSLAIAVVKLARSKLKVITLPIPGMNHSFSIGEKLAKQLYDKSLRGVFVLSDGLKINGSELVSGLTKILPSHVAVTGGLAGDGSCFKETWVLKNGCPTTGYVSALGFYGENINIKHSFKGGWDIFGPERLVTKATANVLYELDGEPALELYKKYLGDKVAGLPATALLFPLQIRLNEGDDQCIVRTVLAVDEKSQSMTFAGNIPQGSLAQLMRANFERLIEGASVAAERLRSQTKDQALLTIAISCVGRRLVLGERTDEEVEATLEKLPQNTQQVGFYSYGEIAPFVRGEPCELHNQTITLTTFYEDNL